MPAQLILQQKSRLQADSTSVLYRSQALLSTLFVLVARISVFYTATKLVFYTFLPLVFSFLLCYITNRKGDTHVQVNLKGSVKSIGSAGQQLSEANRFTSI